MAVPQGRKTRSKRGMHRSHSALTGPTLSVEAKTGETRRRHHVSKLGYYRGKQVINVTPKDAHHDHDHDHHHNEE